MHRSLCTTLLVTVLALGAWALPARSQPCIEVGLGFEPDTVSTGETSVLSASLQNTGDEAAQASLSLTLSYNDHTLGPIEGHIHLNAGKTLAIQIPIRAVPRLMPGTLTLTLEGEAGSCTSQATASLVIEQDEPLPPDAEPLALDSLGSQILAGLAGPVATEPVTWGSLKARYPAP